MTRHPLAVTVELLQLVRVRISYKATMGNGGHTRASGSFTVRQELSCSSSAMASHCLHQLMDRSILQLLEISGQWLQHRQGIVSTSSTQMKVIILVCM